MLEDGRVGGSMIASKKLRSGSQQRRQGHYLGEHTHSQLRVDVARLDQFI